MMLSLAMACSSRGAPVRLCSPAPQVEKKEPMTMTQGEGQESVPTTRFLCTASPNLPPGEGPSAGGEPQTGKRGYRQEDRMDGGPNEKRGNGDSVEGHYGLGGTQQREAIGTQQKGAIGWGRPIGEALGGPSGCRDPMEGCHGLGGPSVPGDLSGQRPSGGGPSGGVLWGDPRESTMGRGTHAP